MNDATPLTHPLAHEQNSIFKCKQHTCTLHDSLHEKTAAMSGKEIFYVQFDFISKPYNNDKYIFMFALSVTF